MIVIKDIKAFIEECEARVSDGSTEHECYKRRCRQIARFHAPAMGKYVLREYNDRNRDYDSVLDFSRIINNTPMQAPLRFVQGYTSNAMSANSPWFQQTPQGALEDDKQMQSTAFETTKILRRILSASNAYSALEMLVAHGSIFGAGLMYIMPDFDNIINCTNAAVGSFQLRSDADGKICGAYRELTMTVRQMVNKFGLENCSDEVKRKYDDKNQRNTSIRIMHICEKFDKAFMEHTGNKQQPYFSAYYECQRGKEEDKLLDFQEHNHTPFVVFRVNVFDDEAYGAGLAYYALPDAKALYTLELSMAHVASKAAHSDLLVDNSLKGHLKGLPNQIIYAPLTQQGQAPVVPLPTITAQSLPALREQIADHKMRIEQAFYNDILLMIANGNQKNVTATAIDEQREEKLLMLGTIHERGNHETMTPFLRIIHEIALQKRVVPPLPGGVRPDSMDIEYTSKLAQALQLHDLTKIERLMGFTGNMAATDPAILDKIDRDEALEDYAKALNANPDIIISKEDVMKARNARQQQQQSQQMIEQAPGIANAAKLLSETDARNNDSLLAGLTGG